jgi:hypothetical protein
MMKPVAFAVAAMAAGYALHALAQPRAEIRTAVSALGTSSSNGVSFAWFFDPADRTVHLCRSGTAAGEAIDCKAQATIP